MSCGSNGQSVFQIGGSACFPISTKGVNGQAIDADALPVISFLTVNGVGVDETTAGFGITLTQVQDDTPAAVTGEYQLCFDPSAFNAGDILEFGVNATIGGVTLSTVRTALIKDEPSERPSIC